MSATPTKMRNFREVLRDEMVLRDRIAAVLAGGALTVPAIAEAIGFPVHETMLWVMAMRRYGLVEEVGRPDDEGYFRYELKKREVAS